MILFNCIMNLMILYVSDKLYDVNCDIIDTLR